MSKYVIDSKIVTWNRDGEFWMESCEETYAYGDSWEEVKERYNLK